ncbi:hypothetical protein M422DRAFT_265906 [Sphaerobolus stellatus SS14]|uniref:DUF6534 domain-containing protein n=1 Tax=Sphaerobolus stellatus (strain SS14) TaxID=990650 RepID=A0A0C9UC67_SPHS4|nr:hypothetical protein M422DRAFT_265906 [Sphaerobolus stellatus SS14]
MAHLSGFYRTQSGIQTLILYSINIGLVTTICAICTLIIWEISPPLRFLWTIFYDPMGSIYVNSLLLSLNARKRIRRRMQITIALSESLEIWGENEGERLCII